MSLPTKDGKTGEAKVEKMRVNWRNVFPLLIQVGLISAVGIVRSKYLAKLLGGGMDW